MYVVHFILVDFNFGWWVTILVIVADHPGYFTWSQWWVTILGMVVYHPWHFTYS